MNYNLITADKLKPLLKTDFFGKKIFAFWRLHSTNALAYKLARNGEEEGTVVIAEEQIKGRGRLNRTWHSQFGKGLWFSLILRPEAHRILKPGVYPFLAGVSVAQAIENYLGLKPEFKWPNDLLLHDKKFCGILSEVEFLNSHIHFIILGIGINVSHRPDDFPPEIRNIATSLRYESLLNIDRLGLLAEIITIFEQNYFFSLEYGFKFIKENWKKRCPRLGQKIEVNLDNQKVNGIFEDLDKDGGLLLKKSDGELIKVVAGDFF